MKKINLNNFSFYKYRYQINYAILFLSFIAIIFYGTFIAPAGITQSEANSVVKSTDLSIQSILSGDVVNLPYRLIQKISLSIFGINLISIKLPSIIISLVSLLFIVKLSKVWFKGNTAIVASIIAVASSQFFFLSQNGTPEILYMFYPIVIILSGAKFLREKSLASLALCVFATAISLYTPLSCYIVLALIATVLAHPHLRFTLKKVSVKEKSTLFGLFLLIISPIILSVVIDFNNIRLLTSLPQSANVMSGFNTLIAKLFSFETVPGDSIVSPIISLPILVLMIVGVYFMSTVVHTAKSYMIIIWSIILLVVCSINPEATTILFVPILILSVSGLQSLAQTWYTLFPRNPYARVAGLIPLGIFIISMLVVNLRTFQLTYLYSPEITHTYSQDLSILPDIKNANLLVADSEKPFYSVLAKNRHANLLDQPEGNKIIATNEAFKQYNTSGKYKISRIITNDRAENSDRFYILESR